MSLTFVNLSKLINPATGKPYVGDRESRLMMGACIHQLAMDYSPRWKECGVALKYAGTVLPDDARDLVVILDTPDQIGVLGEHTERGGFVVAKVFVKPIIDNGGTVLGNPFNPGAPSVSGTLSHELLELAHDPRVNDWVDGPEGMGEVAAELCDPVESCGYAVPMNDPENPGARVDVCVSDFVLPSWFDLQSPKGTPCSYVAWKSNGEQGAPGPFQMAEGGYMVVRKGGAGTEEQVFAGRATYPRWKLEGKASPLSRTYRRGVKQTA